jgi:hypothetical protein
MDHPVVDVDTVAGDHRKIAVVEVLDRDGHLRTTFPVWRWPVTIGRAIDCDVVLDDPHAAARHATLLDAEDTLSLSVGTTINGIQLEGRVLRSGESVTLGRDEVFQIGTTKLRVRLASDHLAPERPLTNESGSLGPQIAGMAVAFTAWNAAQFWLRSDPGGRLSEYLAIVLASLLTLTLWVGFWSVGSKLVQHRFDFRRHARIALLYSLIISAVGAALPLLAYSIGWTFLSRIVVLTAGALVAAMVLAHLTLILPSYRRVLVSAVAAVFVTGAGLFTAHNYQTYERPFGELYVTTLAPPALRLAHGVSTAQFIEDSRSLKKTLDGHVADGHAQDGDSGEDGP